MPIYEYECEKCGTIDEVLQKITDKPLRKCMHCSGKLHKLVSQSSFHLKGTGWYATDYAGKKPSVDPPSKTKKATEKSAGETKKASAQTDKST